MDDDIQPAADAAAPEAMPIDPKREAALSIYTAWRNAHLNNIPVEFFNQLETASEHLVAAIEAVL